jgi:hypothetical protein
LPRPARRPARSRRPSGPSTSPRRRGSGSAGRGRRCPPAPCPCPCRCPPKPERGVSRLEARRREAGGRRRLQELAARRGMVLGRSCIAKGAHGVVSSLWPTLLAVGFRAFWNGWVGVYTAVTGEWRHTPRLARASPVACDAALARTRRVAKPGTLSHTRRRRQLHVAFGPDVNGFGLDPERTHRRRKHEHLHRA